MFWCVTANAFTPWCKPFWVFVNDLFAELFNRDWNCVPCNADPRLFDSATPFIARFPLFNCLAIFPIWVPIAPACSNRFVTCIPTIGSPDIPRAIAPTTGAVISNAFDTCLATFDATPAASFRPLSIFLQYCSLLMVTSWSN